ncbi:hypothetical protein AQ490_09900 [Wenjunlia vitaminophila]|uniref:Uncharacterized protein n=1 Tax=Wenjunlia vitaminophila TaxID=76728 RepID=A0A0T6LMG4_WENVI|nr:hypothetical protein [Wenjunlia vitaminophila]KRV47058.1 hypothetical protein AQ490_09900 [Wenjunlia vitaminophila]
MSQIHPANFTHQRLVLTRDARGFAGVLCALLALYTLVAIIRDIAEVGLHDMFWSWVYGAGFTADYKVTTQLDLQFLVLFLAGVAFCRTAAALPGLVTVGVLTVVLRAAPLLALVSIDAYDGFETVSYGKWALATLITELVLGLVLLLVVLVGRRPANAPTGPGGPPPEPALPPVAPKPAGAVASLLLLGGAALAGAAWQIYLLVDLEWDGYKYLLTGETPDRALTEVQPAVYAWAAVVFFGVAALAGAARSAASRPAGLIAGWMLLVVGVLDVTSYIDSDWFLDTDILGTDDVLWQLTSIYYIVAGLAVLLALLPTEPADHSGQPAPAWQPTGPGWGQPGPMGGPGAPAPGWGPGAPGAAPQQPHWGPAMPPGPPPPPQGGYGPPPQDGRQGW